MSNSSQIAAANSAIDKAEKDFFYKSGKPFKKTNISIHSPYGYFRVDSYPNTSPIDIHHVIFFYNKETGKVFQTFGTLARAYLIHLGVLQHLKKYYWDAHEKNERFLVENDRPLKNHPNKEISIHSKGVFIWNSGTNGVKLYNYALDFEPKHKNKLIAFTEEFDVENPLYSFLNWKDYLSDKRYQKYECCIQVRNVGKPFQILLHETGSPGKLEINRLVNQSKEGSKYYIPHFCVNPVDKKQKGNIIQFVDIAVETWHGELLNPASVGIEFVNTPFDVYDKKTKKYIFKLHSSKKGIYLKTKIKGYSKLFIPLEFSDTKSENSFELEIPVDKVVNSGVLKSLKIGKNKVVEVVGKNLKIKYCTCQQFECLLTFVQKLATASLLNIDLTDIKNWKCCVQVNKKNYFVFYRIYVPNGLKPASLTKQPKDIYLYAVDMQDKGIFCHGNIANSGKLYTKNDQINGVIPNGKKVGDHNGNYEHHDGYLEALYCLLRLCFKLSPKDTLNKMVDLITNGPVSSQKVDAVLLKPHKKKFSRITSPTKITLINCLELS